MNHSVWAVIPARFGSTRFPGKPLVPILGKELLAWVVQGVKAAKLVDQVLVATDDTRIADLAKRCGAMVAMTDSNLPSGTDRIWAAAKESSAGVILNVQGDEPLVTGGTVDSLVAPMLADLDLEMATLAHPAAREDLANPNAVKVIVNRKQDAIYFSRFGIPYSRQSFSADDGLAFRHVGMYAFRRAFLQKFCDQPPTKLELAESLEQLRALHLGARIRVIPTSNPAWGVDTPEDILVIEKIMSEQGRSA